MQSEPATVEQAVRFTHHARKLGVDTTARWMKARRLTRLRDVPPEERDAVITEFETVQPK